MSLSVMSAGPGRGRAAAACRAEVARRAWL